ncbi:MAG: hypothetical protein N3D79_02135 [Acidilobaceae archaeon]|nr:hypothetical protein [Acidilobaceae archaeon]
MIREFFISVLLATAIGIAAYLALVNLPLAAAPEGERLELSQTSSLVITSNRSILSLVVRNVGREEVTITKVEVGGKVCKEELTLAGRETAFISCMLNSRLSVGRVYEVRVYTSSGKYFRAFLMAEESP